MQSGQTQKCMLPELFAELHRWLIDIMAAVCPPGVARRCMPAFDAWLSKVRYVAKTQRGRLGPGAVQTLSGLRIV